MTDAEKLRRLLALVLSLSSTYQAAKDDLVELINGALA